MVGQATCFQVRPALYIRFGLAAIGLEEVMTKKYKWLSAYCTYPTATVAAAVLQEPPNSFCYYT